MIKEESIDSDTICNANKLTSSNSFEGYKNLNGGYAGTRNILGIVAAVQCVTGV